MRSAEKPRKKADRASWKNGQDKITEEAGTGFDDEKLRDAAGGLSDLGSCTGDEKDGKPAVRIGSGRIEIGG